MPELAGMSLRLSRKHASLHFPPSNDTVLFEIAQAVLSTGKTRDKRLSCSQQRRGESLCGESSTTASKLLGNTVCNGDRFQGFQVGCKGDVDFGRCDEQSDDLYAMAAPDSRIRYSTK